MTPSTCESWPVGLCPQALEPPRYAGQAAVDGPARGAVFPQERGSREGACQHREGDDDRQENAARRGQEVSAGGKIPMLSLPVIMPRHKRVILPAYTYVDMNMVRAGVVGHPSDWDWCGYREVAGLRERYRILDFERLVEKLDAGISRRSGKPAAG